MYRFKKVEKSMKKTLTLSMALSTMLLGAGYQIPNNSLNSVALSTAYVANAHGADAAYYNPANMVDNNAEKSYVEFAVTNVSLSPVKYTPDGTANTAVPGAGLDQTIKSDKVTAVLPALHFASSNLAGDDENDVRLGLAILAPAGLTRGWDDAPANATAELFSLQVVEINPSLAIKVNDQLSVGLGARLLRGSGEVKLDGKWIDAISPGSGYNLDMDGSGLGLGGNIALAYKPLSNLNLSATYRSEVYITLEGDAKANLTGLPFHPTNPSEAAQTSKVNLTIPVPANLIIAAAYTFESDTTVEVTYDKTYWSALKSIDMNFNNPYLEGSLGVPSLRNWNDSQSYRLGITQKLGDATVMAGIAVNDNPADEEYVTYSSPETDSMTYSLGGKYDFTEALGFGLAALYSKGSDRTVSQPTANPLTGVNGKISEKDVLAITAALTYTY